MNEYRFTFGFKYADEPHPSCPWAHPDGWLAVIAPDAAAAHALAHAIIGPVDGPGTPIAYAFSYGPEEWQAKNRHGMPWGQGYTRGELARITYQIN